MRRFTMLNREDGVAMITAIVVSSIVLLFSVTLVQLSLHNSNSSAYDRGRVEAVNAAEAGVNLAFSQMERYGFASLPCGSNSLSGDLVTTPVEHYSVQVDYYSSYPPSGNAMTCPLTTKPAGAVITSTGTTPGVSAAAPARRIMQAEVRLSPITLTGSFVGAIFGASSVSMSNNSTINGYEGNDGDVYTGGTWTCSNSTTIYGSVYANTVTAPGNPCIVNQDVWANGSVTASGTLTVGHDVTSSTSSITLNGASHVTHNATSGTTCTGCTIGSGGRVSGTVTTNHISQAPPLPSYPNITYTASDWTSEGYTIKTYSDCTAAKTFLLDPGDSNKYVVRITPACNLQITSQSIMTVRNDIAVIADGNINITNKFTLVSADGQQHTVYWIVPAGTPCGTINFNNVSTSSNLIRQILYVPSNCTVAYTNGTGLYGQIFGGTVNATNTFSMNYWPISVPGHDLAPGFQVDISYLREITG